MPFQKGNTLGKAGRPKGSKSVHTRVLGPQKAVIATTTEFATECRTFGPEIISRWVTIMRDDKAPLDLRLRAMDRLVDRGFGRVAQPHDHDHRHVGAFGTFDLDKLTHEQLVTLDEILTLATPASSVGDTD